jgi:Zn-finger nucleic acid-binding protein
MSDDYTYDNEYGNGYTYDTYQDSGEVKNPLEVEPQPESNEYSNDDIANSLDSDYNQSNDYGYSM